MLRCFSVRGTGKYIPKKAVFSTELDKKFGLQEGTTERRTGVMKRHYVEKESNSEMAKYAILEALKEAKMELSDIDLILAASGTQQQPIPCNAALIHEELGLQGSGIPAFDVNSTCLSFLVGLDLISYPLHFGKYNNVVIVTSEIASIGLNYESFESSSLFGDGAVAFIISRDNSQYACKILSSHIETYSEGAHFTEIRGGGTNIHPRAYSEVGESEFTFDMDGKAVVKLSIKHGNDFMKKLLADAKCSMDDVAFFVPHQVSSIAMELMAQKMEIPKNDERIVRIIGDYGNIIAACIPLTWHELRKSGKAKKGDKIVLFGTSAGLTLGGMVIEL